MNNEDIPADVNALPDPASFASPNGPKKRRKRRQLDEPGGLTMNSLMDIMTILLVFLLKSYSTDPVQLKQAPDLKPPFSTSELKPQESTVITVTLNNILVDDGVAQIPVTDGELSKEYLEGGGGFLIGPLLDQLNETVEHDKKVYRQNKNREFSGIVTIVADRHVPFRLLSQVMYTAGQATFSKFKFMVVKGKTG